MSPGQVFQDYGSSARGGSINQGLNNLATNTGLAPGSFSNFPAMNALRAALPMVQAFLIMESFFGTVEQTGLQDNPDRVRPAPAVANPAAHLHLRQAWPHPVGTQRNTGKLIRQRSEDDIGQGFGDGHDRTGSRIDQSNSRSVT